MGQFDTRKMPKQRAMGIKHALWIAGCTGCIDDDGRVLGGGFNSRMVHRSGLDEPAPLAHASVAAFIDADQCRSRRKLIRDIEQFLDFRRIGDHDLGTAVIQAILYGLRAEKREQRQRDCPQPISRKMRDQCLRALRQQNADSVPPRDAERAQCIRQPPRTILQMLEAHVRHATISSLDHQGRAIRTDMPIADRLRDVEVCRYLPPEIRADLLIRRSNKSHF